MKPVSRARWLGWSALALLALAVPMFFVPDASGSFGDRRWATAGAVALHPAAFAGLGAFFTYRDLDDEDRARAVIARLAFPVVMASVVLLWLFWA